MANELVVQSAVLSALAVILLCLFVVYRKRKAAAPIARRPPQGEQSVPLAIARETARVDTPASFAMNASSIVGGIAADIAVVTTEAPAPVVTAVASVEAMVVHEQPVLTPPAIPVIIHDDRNQRILAGISDNIRKSLIKPVPTYSPIEYPEKRRDTEYVRVKKQILTPHGQIRFSILKDSLATNMLAVFRRACMEWKTPEDLIGFLPSYLEPEAEILNDQILLVGTPGHNEKLAIPIRSVDAKSRFREYFDFVTDDRTATNTPAVLLTTDTDFEIVSRGVITRPVFLDHVEEEYKGTTILVEKSSSKMMGRVRA